MNNKELIYTYLHESHTLYTENGELHIISDTQHIVINIDTFIHDLPYIVRMCKNEYNKTNKELFKRIKNSLK